MLYRINLLPWRENQREEHRRRFISLVALGVLVALVFNGGVLESFLSTNKISSRSGLITSLTTLLSSTSVLKQ